MRQQEQINQAQSPVTKKYCQHKWVETKREWVSDTTQFIYYECLKCKVNGFKTDLDQYVRTPRRQR